VLTAEVVVAFAVVVVVQILVFESAKDVKGFGEVLNPTENGFKDFCDELKELKLPSVLLNFVSASLFELTLVTSKGLILA